MFQIIMNIQRIAIGVGRSVYRNNAFSSSSVSVMAKNIKKPEPPIEDSILPQESTVKKSKNPLVAAAFDSLLSKEDQPSISESNNTQIEVDPLDKRILNASTVKGLLSIADGSSTVTRKHALKIVSILAEWSSINRVKLSDFENDPKFIKICRLLGRAVPKASENGNIKNKVTGFRTDDLNTVIGVAGDDEAAKLIASISIPQMIRVMSTLAQKKRRSIPLLRSVANNISSNAEPLDLKQCADLLYAMAMLNFPDSVLISRISIDIQNGLLKNSDKPAAVGSIITSLGLLKYRDADLLENLTDWIIQHSEICRPQDISSLFLTLAVLNYPTTKANLLQSKLVANLVKEDFRKHADWLNNIWALVILNFAEEKHFESVLNKDFIEQLVVERGGDLPPTMKMKLLNINSSTQLLSEEYKGSKLDASSSIYSVPIVANKNKQILINGLLDALKSLFTSDSLLRTNHNTNMGFIIDAECVLDKKRKPMPVADKHADATRIAIMVLDFHDMCQGAHQQPNGITGLALRLLEKNGYTILSVPYNEFNTSDKLLKRVQYLDEKLKRITSNRK